MYTIEALDLHFQAHADVYVSGNLCIYYEAGNPWAVVAPDIFVVLEAPKRDHASYLLWTEPKGLSPLANGAHQDQKTHVDNVRIGFSLRLYAVPGDEAVCCSS